MNRKRKWFLILFAMLIIIFIAGLSIGPASLSIDRLLPVLFGSGSFKEEFILFSIRMPRLLVLALAGMALAVSGTILQSITRNDLADPGIIGINAGAGVGVTILYLFVKAEITNFAFILPIAALIGAFATAVCITVFSYKRNAGIRPVALVIVGVGFAAALSGIMMILISSAEPSDVQFIASWLAGNVWGTDWPFIWALLPWLLFLVPLVYYKANVLNILALNEQTAIGLGMNLRKERLLLIGAAVALAAAAVSMTGGISFIGLIAPHIAKTLVGPRHQHALPIALMFGAILLMTADIIGQNIMDAAAIPTGIVVALIGAPYFLYLLKKI